MAFCLSRPFKTYLVKLSSERTALLGRVQEFRTLAWWLVPVCCDALTLDAVQQPVSGRGSEPMEVLAVVCLLEQVKILGRVLSCNSGCSKSA